MEIRKTELFARWIDGLEDIQARARIQVRIEHLPFGNSVQKVNTTPYDVAEHLRTPKEMAAYLQACIDEADGDAAFIAKALGDIARAKGMAEVAREAGLSRESLYKALSGDRSPEFGTILRVMAALGLRLRAEVSRHHKVHSRS